MQFWNAKVSDLFQISALILFFLFFVFIPLGVEISGKFRYFLLKNIFHQVVPINASRLSEICFWSWNQMKKLYWFHFSNLVRPKLETTLTPSILQYLRSQQTEWKYYFVSDWRCCQCWQCCWLSQLWSGCLQTNAQTYCLCKYQNIIYERRENITKSLSSYNWIECRDLFDYTQSCLSLNCFFQRPVASEDIFFWESSIPIKKQINRENYRKC